MNVPNLRSEGLTQESLKLTQNFIIGGLTQPLPDSFQSVEIGRITMLMFYLGAYKILFPEQPLNKVIDTEKTIQYILTSLSIKSDSKEIFQGFTGCEMYGIFKHGHISYTYAALASLSQLGYDLRRIDKSKIVKSYHTLFRKECKGVFATSLEEEGEYDIRFVYSLCATCYLLNDWGSINKEILFEFIMSCRSYDFAFGQMPKRESHGGSTYCAIQSLSLMGMINRLDHIEELVQWLVQKSYLGFSGRINKPADTCYNYWIGSTLKTLGYEHLIDKKFVLAFTENCVSKRFGGIGKNQEALPDPMHTFCSLTGLSLIGALPVKYTIDSRIGIEKPSYL
ncbi:hypothetical protein ENUP19_0198G0013 [Entamoeba nuttalli]|uniref:Geranylgeranyl transferase type-1 subunit beta n=2 Tax=Entamoeba nuttalli TaxID=412467 RepID=K2HD69_ENTNP|nr:geranylgeranyl transferase beta subunit [Entamoeba nuttalli P19]EKE40664.1 geranylgeranyl transferase beta subunit [Entamoeba nuttalli P19]|eukprot:XP_008857001.1 geranylgeranyl transferase beta subunit [Entamoeba nuttalli P19]